MNPGGSVKDRVALRIIKDAEEYLIYSIKFNLIREGRLLPWKSIY